MRTVFFLAALLLALPLVAQAFQTETYGWEETATVLGIYGNGIATIEDTSPVYNGTQSLKFEESPLGGTPQAFVGWIQDLNDGDTVAASFWVYDDTPGTNPSGRIWGHWNDDPSDPTVYDGSAGGNADYSAGTGWSFLEWEWTVVDGHTGLTFEPGNAESLADQLSNVRTNPELISRLAQAGHNLVYEKFNIKGTILKIEQYLLDLIP